MRLVYGIGINDADHRITVNERIGGKLKQTWICPYYSTWKGILMRTKESFWLKNPTYHGCKINKDWLRFSNFETWLKEQPSHAEWLANPKDWAVDKDFVFPGNKTYSPETCCLLPRYVNNALLDSSSIRGEYPLGVSYHKQHKKLYSCIKIEGKQHFLGLHSDTKEAHKAWQVAKIDALKGILTRYRKENHYDNRICVRLLDEIYLIEEDVKNARETKRFGRMA